MKKYHIPNKRYLLKKLYDSKNISKFDMKSEQLRFLGHDIIKNTMRRITRSLESSTKFLNEIKDKKQLQRFLGLKYNQEPWSQKHTNIPHPNAKIVVETDMGDIGLGGILKQKMMNSKD
uniref:Uncharacterized protein n=1 Tax=Lactuca sativa TaxID=4236 RepID=A0A9R1VH42_LACSA|nr:hypothetical protein LSAT_V11C500253870 [Lactuca sativa]